MLAMVAPGIGRAQDACHAAGGAPVDRIEVYGLERVSPGVVEDAVKLRPGMIVSPLSLAKLEDTVLATGLFATASVVIVSADDGCVLRVRVEEYPPVREVRFRGVSVYPEEDLRAALATKTGAPANRATVASDAQAIAAKYRADGYEAARVTGTEITGGTVTFRVAEGHIARIDVVGARRTGAARVREILGIRAGQVYRAESLVDGQAALYRTDLFGSVGFGVETPSDDPEAGIVLTVHVDELSAPFSRTELYADADQSALAVQARIRNLARGHSASAAVSLLGASPADLAADGFDRFYLLDANGALHFFRPTETAASAFLGIDADLVHGRRRPDVLGSGSFNLDRPAARAGVEIPAVRSDDWEGTGSFAGVVGLRVLRTFAGDPHGTPLSSSDAGFGRGELGFELHRLAGLETPASVAVTTGVEWNGGARPLSWIDARGNARLAITPWLKTEIAADAGALSGQYIPYWREYALQGVDGPVGFGHDFGFARQFARGRGDVVVSAIRGLVGVAAGGGAVVFSGANGAATTTNLQSVHGELRAGPPFARLRAGVAAPLPGATTTDLWWYVGLTVGTPQ